MNCPRCNAPNENDARFCKNCGLPFYQYQAPPVSPVNPFAEKPVEDKSALYVSIILGLICIETISFLILDKVIIPAIYGKDYYGPEVSKIYNVDGWVFNLTEITFSIIFLIRTKNKMVRIVLIAFAAIQLFNFIMNDILPLFENKTNFFQF